MPTSRKLPGPSGTHLSNAGKFEFRSDLDLIERRQSKPLSGFWALFPIRTDYSTALACTDIEPSFIESNGLGSDYCSKSAVPRQRANQSDRATLPGCKVSGPQN